MYFSESVLQILCYLIVTASVIFYTVLDGFDLGVGSLHLFVKSDQDRRTFLNAIGPVWDGNEVWLVIIGGSLFSCFPNAFATIFSAFYTPTMLFLAGIIFRAVAIEFRSKHHETRWRSFWDIVFAVASIVIAFGAGVLLGNIIMGIPINASMEFVGGLKDFISIYTILVGFMTVALFMIHGLTFLLMKTEGELHDRLRRFVDPVMLFFSTLYVITTISTLFYSPHMIDRFHEHPMLFIIPLLSLLAILSIPFQVKRKNDGLAFISSSLSIILLFVLFGIGTFPVILRSSLNPEMYSLTLQNTAASRTTMEVVLVIALIGIPLVLGYGYFLYRVFRGKVKLDASSY